MRTTTCQMSWLVAVLFIAVAIATPARGALNIFEFDSEVRFIDDFNGVLSATTAPAPATVVIVTCGLVAMGVRLARKGGSRPW